MSVLLLLGSSPILYILGPRRQDAYLILELIISLFSLVLFSKDFYWCYCDFPEFSLPFFQINMYIYHPDISLKYWKERCLRQSQRNYSSIHPFWITCPFFSSFLHLLLLVFPLYPWRHQIYTVAFSLACLSLLVFAIHFFYWLPVHHLVLWFSCSSASSFMSSLILPSFHHTFDSSLTLIAALADISSLKIGFLFQDFYLLLTLYLYIHHTYISNMGYTYVASCIQKQIQKWTIGVFSSWNSADVDSCYKRRFLVLFSQQRYAQIVYEENSTYSY